MQSLDNDKSAVRKCPHMSGKKKKV